ncbi:MAG: putative motility protein [Spirochaetales bacterium]|nr:putative motility protein [Spirochaetales bacterium]
MDNINRTGEAAMAPLSPRILKKAMDQQAEAALKLIQSNTDNLVNSYLPDYLGNRINIKV